MKRYVVHNKNGWSLVNANYKRSIRNFNTQIEAIEYAAQMKNTSTLLVHNKQGKFRKISGWDQTNTKTDIHKSLAENNQKPVVAYIPNYVLKNTSQEVSKQVKRSRIYITLWFIVIALIIAAIVFGILYGVELGRLQNV